MLAIPLYVGAQTSDKPSQTQTSNKKSSVDYFATDRAKKARQNWILNCQGCHKIDGTGRPEKGLPNLTGEVARFLHTPGGREYLSRVPGVTNASINDEDLTDLINWLLVRFDPEHIPQGHQPYTVQEVSQGRAHPLSIGAADKRADLLLALSKNTKN
ncbi:MAG TPA: cytochrome C [Hellea balneolensis]|uniref:Cytochrome C n=1 Tax=Hellea balneolensis TaxID=287478 RepID=A0A7C3C101_9PROT|nr:cytochrome C [Hellea balneolensis]